MYLLFKEKYHLFHSTSTALRLSLILEIFFRRTVGFLAWMWCSCVCG